jgi:hypothetical protein
MRLAFFNEDRIGGEDRMRIVIENAAAAYWLAKILSELFLGVFR